MTTVTIRQSTAPSPAVAGPHRSDIPVMCAPEVSTVTIGADTRKKTTGAKNMKGKIKLSKDQRSTYTTIKISNSMMNTKMGATTNLKMITVTKTTTTRLIDTINKMKTLLEVSIPTDANIRTVKTIDNDRQD